MMRKHANRGHWPSWRGRRAEASNAYGGSDAGTAAASASASVSDPASLSGPLSGGAVQDPYREAKARTEERSRLFSQLALVASVLLFFAFAADFESAITIGLIVGIFMSRRIYRVLLAPRLERKWLAEELDLLRARSSLDLPRRDQRSRNVEVLSASIAHEIRNPITAAKSLVQQIGEDPSAPENLEYAQVAIEELDRVERSIAHLLRFAKEEPIDFGRVNLEDIVASAVESFRDRFERDGVKLEQSHDAALALTGDAEKLRRIVINLISNALDAMNDAGTKSPTLQISTGLDLSGNQAWLAVRDNGPGIEPDRVDRIFSPFHTSKANGTGLGLAIAKKLAEAHGGTLEVRSERGRFTEMILTLPRTGSRHEAAI
ncbi:MAG: GHKL domain-containing protein [Deltaproteobacteria bacterium]|nr:GHKL domain-containing protein [Deltaproteobacteria bacterium]